MCPQQSRSILHPGKLTWRATCGVDGSRWIAEMKDDSKPPPGGSFCPDCQERKMVAPGVLNWKVDPDPIGYLVS